MSTFREDGPRRVDWVAVVPRARARATRCSARVEPGEIRAALPASPPDEAEPFAAVLRDLDGVLMPGITHWQSPRYFAYFATTARSPAFWRSC